MRASRRIIFIFTEISAKAKLRKVLLERLALARPKTSLPEVNPPLAEWKRKGFNMVPLKQDTPTLPPQIVSKSFLAIFLTFLFFRLVSAQLVEEESYSCMVCHGEQKVEYKESIHAKMGILCHDCHGGDPSSLDQEESMSKKAGFLGKPTRKDLVFLCGNCHADIKRMKPFGIPTHQLEDYKTSQHGIAVLERNDPNGATCTDCHGTHRIFLADDPKSKVFPTNLPQTCAECHSQKELMDKYHLPSNTFEEYAKGIHGVFLLEKNDRSAPTCARCHGNHGALPPGVSEVEHVCGQCHLRAMEYFDKSPHLGAMKRREMAQCVSCHQPHRTEIADGNMLGPVCANCHEEDCGAYKRGQQIKTLLLEVQLEIEDAEKIIAQAKLKGVDVTEDEVGLERAKTNLTEAIPKVHALNLSWMEESTVPAKSIASDIKLRIHEILESFRLRKVALGFVWLFILFTVTILYLKKKRADREFDLSQASSNLGPGDKFGEKEPKNT